MRVATAAALSIALLFAAAPAAGGAPQRLPRRAATVRVGISDFAFHPHTLTVSRGTTVVFANGDGTAHTATAGGGSFATGHIRPGHSAAVKLGQAGVFPYHCSIHHFMHGKIVVR
jgi:plastocyanin